MPDSLCFYIYAGFKESENVELTAAMASIFVLQFTQMAKHKRFPTNTHIHTLWPILKGAAVSIAEEMRRFLVQLYFRVDHMGLLSSSGHFKGRQASKLYPAS